jgi:hypothetical protein
VLSVEEAAAAHVEWSRQAEGRLRVPSVRVLPSGLNLTREPRMRHLALAALALATSGCTIDTAIAGGWRVSPRLADACVDHCHVLNMRLAAVVVVHATGGCVCEPLDRPSAAAWILERNMRSRTAMTSMA